jgi:hypothetical protein
MSEMAAMGYAEWKALWSHIGYPGNARPTASYHKTLPYLHHGLGNDHPVSTASLLQPAHAYHGSGPPSYGSSSDDDDAHH